MNYEIFPTTAEHVINVTDLVLLKGEACTLEFAAKFLDIPEESTSNALSMACQLKLIEQVQNTSYRCPQKLSTYLVCGKEHQKAAVLRLVLEQYEPYRVFRQRLAFTGSIHVAAEQTKQLLELGAHREEIKDTIISLGTYAHSLVSEGAGLYRIAEDSEQNADYLLAIAEVASDRTAAELTVRRLLGDDVCNWLNVDEVLNPFYTAFLMLANSDNEPRSPILYAGNAVESFVVQLASHHGLSTSSSPGINAKVDTIKRAGYLNSKYSFILKYLGHVRNACDHGIDPEIGVTWEISPETSKEYVYVALTCIKHVVHSVLHGRFVI